MISCLCYAHKQQFQITVLLSPPSSALITGKLPVEPTRADSFREMIVYLKYSNQLVINLNSTCLL